MIQRFTQIDAFTDRPFTGNPAAVCLLPSARDAHWMQQIALEMNLAETAFLVRRPDGFDLRWFTPGAEVDLCGHATLASAHALWEEGHLKASEVARFHTRSGVLTATRSGDHIWLDFPSTPVSPAAPPDGLEAGIGADATMVGRTAFDYLVELESEAAVRSLAPDMNVIAGIPYRGVIVTAPSDGPQIRLRLTLLRARVGHSRGPGHGIGTLRTRAVLGSPTGQRPNGGISGFITRRHGAGQARWEPCASRRAGSYGAAG